MKLFLFDIDGTLMRRTGPYHGDALIAAVQQVLGLDSTLDGIPVHGMLDGDILAEMLRRCGQSPEQTSRALPELMRCAQEIYPATCPNLASKVLPGVRETLEEIARAGYPMALVTGNLTEIGWTKVERAGLRHFFPRGAFADMGTTRAELAGLAHTMSACAPGTAITLTGDAPSDVQAAQANGFRSVAVATGMTSYEELAALQPDVLLNDLSRPEDRHRLIHG